MALLGESVKFICWMLQNPRNLKDFRDISNTSCEAFLEFVAFLAESVKFICWMLQKSQEFEGFYVWETSLGFS